MIQDELNKLYASLKKPKVLVDDSILKELEGPDLIWASPAYENANPRIAIIGKEAFGWDYWYYNFVNDVKWSIEEAIEVTCKFNYGEKYIKSPFWQFFTELREHFFGSNAERSIVGWLNLIKFTIYNNKGRRTGVLGTAIEEQALALQDGIFIQELKIMKPDICVFVTGPDYDRILRRYYPEISFNDTGLTSRILAKLSHTQLPSRSFRTYHPNYLRRSKKWKIVMPHLINLIEKKLD